MLKTSVFVDNLYLHASLVVFGLPKLFFCCYVPKYKKTHTHAHNVRSTEYVAVASLQHKIDFTIEYALPLSAMGECPVGVL